MTEPDRTAWTVVQLLRRVRAWAVFAVGAGNARLIASDRIDQRCLRDMLHPHPGSRAVGAPAHTADEDVSGSHWVVTLPRCVGRAEHAVLYLENPPAYPWLPSLLDLDVHDFDAVLRTTATAPSTGLPRTGRKTEAKAAEKELLLALLDRHDWNAARVARHLGVVRSTLYHRMRRHSILQRASRPRVPRHQGGATARGHAIE